MPYRELADIALANEKDPTKCMAVLMSMHPNLSVEQVNELSDFIGRDFLPKFRQRWQSVHRKLEAFEVHSGEWLKNTFRIGEVEDDTSEPVTPRRDRGRPVKTFADSSERSKRRRIKETRDGTDPELLRRAAITPQISSAPALAFFLQNNFTKAQYESIRQLALGVDVDLLPAYNTIGAAKTETYQENIETTETRCVVPLESLLIHTARRLMESMTEAEVDSMESDVIMVAKWGCDGSSGHSNYTQKFSNTDFSDEALFLTSMVPLQIRRKADGSRLAERLTG